MCGVGLSEFAGRILSRIGKKNIEHYAGRIGRMWIMMEQITVD